MIEVVRAFDRAPIAKLEHVRFAPITLRLAEQEPLDQNLSDGYHAHLKVRILRWCAGGTGARMPKSNEQPGEHRWTDRSFLEGSSGRAALPCWLPASSARRLSEPSHKPPREPMECLPMWDRSRPHSAKRAAMASMSIVWTPPPVCGHTPSTSAASQTPPSLL